MKIWLCLVGTVLHEPQVSWANLPLRVYWHEPSKTNRSFWSWFEEETWKESNFLRTAGSESLFLEGCWGLSWWKWKRCRKLTYMVNGWFSAEETLFFFSERIFHLVKPLTTRKSFPKQFYSSLHFVKRQIIWIFPQHLCSFDLAGAQHKAVLGEHLQHHYSAHGPRPCKWTYYCPHLHPTKLQKA